MLLVDCIAIPSSATEWEKRRKVTLLMAQQRTIIRFAHSHIFTRKYKFYLSIQTRLGAAAVRIAHPAPQPIEENWCEVLFRKAQQLRNHVETELTTGRQRFIVVVFLPLSWSGDMT